MPMPTHDTSLRLLMVEDVEANAALLVHTLEQGGYTVLPRRVETAEALRAALEEQSWDFLTSDLTLPSFSAPAAVALAQSLCPDLPIVMVSDEISPRLAVELLQAGARSFVPRDNISALPPVVAHELRAVEAERQRRQAEMALRESEARWQAALEGAGEGVWDWNLQTGEIFFSRQWKALLGYAEDEVITLDMWEALVHPDDHARVMASDPALYAGQITTLFDEYRILCKGGTYKWIQSRGKVISFTPDGKPLRAIGTQSDITQRKEAEARYRSVVENAPVGMQFFELAEGGHLIFTGSNPAADAILGQRHAGLVGQTLESAFPQLAATEIPQHFCEAAEQGTYWQADQIGYIDGQIASAYAIHAIQTTPGRMVAVFENILERKRAEEIIQAQAEALHSQNQELRLQNQELTAQGQALHRTEAELRASEEKYRTLIETTDTGYIIIDAEGRVLDANAEYLRLTGRQSAEEILGHRVTEWTAPHDRERNAREVQACLEEGFVRNLEIDYVDPEGRLTPVEINATTMSTDDGPIIVGLCRDIAERKEAEKVRRENEESLLQIASALREAVWLRDTRSLALLYINPAYEAIWGRTRESFYKDPASFLEAVHPEDKARILEAVQAHSQGKFFDEEYRIIRPDGSQRWVWGRTFPVRNEAGEVYRVTAVAEDITQRREAEQTLRASEQRYRELNRELERQVAEYTRRLEAANAQRP